MHSARDLRCRRAGALSARCRRCRVAVTGSRRFPPPSFGLVFEQQEARPLPEVTAHRHPQDRVAGRRRQGGPGSASRLSLRDAIYAASTNGTLVRVDPADRRDRRGASRRRSACRRAPARTRRIVAVGTDKGDVLAVRPGRQADVAVEGHERGREPRRKVAEGIVVVWSGDGRIFGALGRRRQDALGLSRAATRR